VNTHYREFTLNSSVTVVPLSGPLNYTVLSAVSVKADGSVA